MRRELTKTVFAILAPILVVFATGGADALV